MATQTLFQEHYHALDGMVRRWDRRLRLRYMLLWMPFSLVPGLLIGTVLALISWERPLLLPVQIARIAGAGVALGAVLFTLGVWLWRRPALTSARRFDLRFGLGERISTALELGTGVIHANDELAQRQIEDARARASAIRVRERIPLALRLRDWVIVIVMAVLLALLLILPNPQVSALTQTSIQQGAINGAANQINQTAQDIAADTSLGNEQRQTLLQQLQTTLNTLQQPNVSPQEALAAVSAAQTALRNNADALNQQSSADQAALQSIANALRLAGSTSSDTQASSPSQQATQDLSNSAPNALNMTPGAQQATEQAPPSNGNAIQQPMQSLSNIGQPAQNTAPGAQQATEQAQPSNGSAIQQATQDLSNSAPNDQNMTPGAPQQNQPGQPSPSNQTGQQNPSNQPGQQSQSNQPAQQQSQPNQSGQQSQPNQSGQQSQSSQPGQQPGQPDQQGNGPSQSAQQMTGQNPSESQSAQQSQPGQQSQTSSETQQGTTLNAGEQPGDPQQDDTQGNQAGRQEGNSTNNPTHQGAGQFESVNVPQRIGDQPNNGDNIQLQADPSNAPAQQGDFTQNPNGQVTVPYDQVFGDYANAANQALNSDYVPLGLRDVVRDYFTSLEPKK